MDHCKFENTLEDLNQCLTSIDEGETINDMSELTALLELRRACKDMSEYTEAFLETLYVGDEEEDEDEYYEDEEDETEMARIPMSRNYAYRR